MDHSNQPWRETSSTLESGATCLNAYGDHGRILPGSLGYGTDISYDRLDDLDQKAIYFARELAGRAAKAVRPLALDIGCGYGRVSVEFASAGVDVVAVDLADTRSFIERELSERLENKRSYQAGSVNFVRGDVTSLALNSLFGGAVSLIYSQRFLHYIRYEAAIGLFSQLRTRMAHGGKVFMGVSGLDTDLGKGYGHRKLAITKRFCKLNSDDAAVGKHHITQPVCLYTMDELGTLFEQTGYKVVELYQSRFGNIKGVFTPQ